MALFGAADAFRPASGILATFAGFIAAAIVPTMILAATILRPARFGIGTVQSYGVALRQQLYFFAGVFVLASLLIIVLVVAEILRWESHIWNIGNGVDVLIDRAAIINAFIGFLAALLVFRTFEFVSGVRSLFELHLSMVEQEVAARVKDEAASIFNDDPSPKDTRAEFGKVLRIGPQSQK